MKKIDMSTEYDKYLAYLNSQKWAELRNKTLERDGYHCSICGNPNNLEVHHLKYPDTLGTEPLSDLMTLCRDCHKRLEEYKKGHERSQSMYVWYPPKETEWKLWLKFRTLEDYESVAPEFKKEFYSYGSKKTGRSLIMGLLEDTRQFRTLASDLTHEQLESFEQFVNNNFSSICEAKIQKQEELTNAETE